MSFLNFSDGVDLYYALLHEIGHVLGLPHLSDITSIMYRVIDPFRSQRHLNAKTIALIQRIYGKPYQIYSIHIFL